MKRSGLLASASVIGSLTMLSRLLGMVRDIVAANIFGAILAMDAFVIAFTIPNLLRRLLGEGALTSAFLPVYSHTLENEGKEKAQVFFNAILTRLGILLILLTLSGIGGCFLVEAVVLNTPALEVGLILTGGVKKVLLTCSLLKVLFPYVFLICVTALLAALLNALGHFASPAAAPVVLNIFWIGGLLILAPRFGAEPDKMIFGVAVAVIIGGVAQVLAQIPALRARGIGYRPSLKAPPREVGEVARLMAPLVFGAAVIQINVLIDKGIAMTLVKGSGAVSYLYYGDRIIQFPLGLFAIAIATAVFPILSRHVARGEMKEAASSAAEAMKLVFAVIVPATVGLAILAHPTVEVLYQRGAFEDVDTDRTAWVLLLYSLGLWAYSGQHILTRAFYSMKWAATPVKVASIMVGLNLTLNLALVGPMAEAGLALATAICGMLQFLILLLILQRRLPEMRDLGILGSFLRCLGVSGIMGTAAWGTLRFAVHDAGGLLRLLVPLVVGVVVYAGVTAGLRTPEFSTLIQAMKRRK